MQFNEAHSGVAEISNIRTVPLRKRLPEKDTPVKVRSSLWPEKGA